MEKEQRELLYSETMWSCDTYFFFVFAFGQYLHNTNFSETQIKHLGYFLYCSLKKSKETTVNQKSNLSVAEILFLVPYKTTDSQRNGYFVLYLLLEAMGESFFYFPKN